jgi:hypothetical protein
MNSINIDVIKFGDFKSDMINKLMNKELTLDECNELIREKNIKLLNESGLNRKQFNLQLAKYKSTALKR